VETTEIWLRTSPDPKLLGSASLDEPPCTLRSRRTTSPREVRKASAPLIYLPDGNRSIDIRIGHVPLLGVFAETRLLTASRGRCRAPDNR